MGVRVDESRQNTRALGIDALVGDSASRSDLLDNPVGDDDRRLFDDAERSHSKLGVVGDQRPNVVDDKRTTR